MVNPISITKNCLNISRDTRSKNAIYRVKSGRKDLGDIIIQRESSSEALKFLYSLKGTRQEVIFTNKIKKISDENIMY